MTETLALKYRPSKFSEMVGQNMVSVVLDQMVKNSTVPTGLLFAGTRGTGKTSAARILAKELGCEDVDILEIDAASKGGVADIRDLTESLRYQASGPNRVIILDEAHSMSREAFNALLKTLEEPSAGTTFILVTTEPHRIPETVLSRLIAFEFKRVSPADIFQRLSVVATEEEISVESSLLQYLSERANGSIRDALMSLDLCSRAGIQTVAKFRELQSEYDVGPVVLLRAASTDTAAMFTTVDKALSLVGDPSYLSTKLIETLRDLMILRSGGTLAVTGGGLRLREELNQKLEPERIFGALRLLWDLKTKIRSAEDSRSSFDLALMLVSDLFTRGRQQAPVAAPQQPPKSEVPKTVSFEELKKRVHVR